MHVGRGLFFLMLWFSTFLLVSYVFWLKLMIWAKNSLTGMASSCFSALKYLTFVYDNTVCEMWRPHLVIYLDAPIDFVRTMINKRNVVRLTELCEIHSLRQTVCPSLSSSLSPLAPFSVEPHPSSCSIRRPHFVSVTVWHISALCLWFNFRVAMLFCHT